MSDRPNNTEPREVFSMLAYRWDVTAAKALVQRREPNGRADPTEWAGIGSLIRIDREHAKTVDLDEPLIAVPIPGGGGPLVIDGWHRLWRAHSEQAASLPVHVLTSEEEFQIRIYGGGKDLSRAGDEVSG